MTTSINQNKTIARLLAVGFTICLSFWVIANLVNVYEYAVVGALFEIMWLPVILIGFAVPVVALMFWIREKFRIRSPFMYIAALSIVTNVLLITS